jgi:hypothetical protein
MRGSLLDDIDDILSDGDELAPAIVANMQDSDLRKFFGIGAGVEKPFEFSDGGRTLIVSPRSRFLRVGDSKLNDITIDTIDTLICKSSFGYYYSNPSEKLCNCIKADSFNFNEFAAVTFKDMEIHAGNYSGDKVFPNIIFNSGKASAELTNSRLEIDYSVTKSALLQFSGDIPIFKNVKSDTIRKIEITDRRGIQFSNKKLNAIADIFGNKRWNDLFEFGYVLEEKKPDYGIGIKIKSIKDLRKIVASRKFWLYEFDQFPYRLKKGAKLSDFIDVSGFKDLHNIQIYDNKMNVLLINTKNASIKEFIGHVASSLRQQVSLTVRTAIEDIPFPVTTDGWAVVINQLC